MGVTAVPPAGGSCGSEELHRAQEPFKSEPQPLCTPPVQALANAEPPGNDGLSGGKLSRG